MDVTLRGRTAAFRDRLTNVRERQIKSVTSSGYWRVVQAFLTWSADEGFIDASPAEGLKVADESGSLAGSRRTVVVGSASPLHGVARR